MPYFDKNKKKWRAAVMREGERFQALFDTKAEAKGWEAEKKREVASKQEQTPDDMELRVFFSRYLDHAEMRFSVKVFKEKRALLQKLSRLWGGGTLLKAVTVDMVASYLETQAKERSNNASNKDRKNLLALWNWGIERFDLKHNPVSKISSLRHDREPQYTPPEGDVLRVLAVATGEERIFLNVYLQTAARRSEVFRWTWMDDINFEKKEVRLGTRKTKDGSMEYAWLPMSEDLHTDLMWLWKNRQFKESPYVFVCGQPGPRYGQPFLVRRKFLKGLCARAGVRPFGFHALRRYVAYTLADTHKISAKTIQRVLRHKHVTTTEIYLQNTNKDLSGVMNLLSH